MKNLLSQIKRNVSNYVPNLSFRDGQRPIVTALVDDLKKGTTSMYVDGPTGIGKTFIESVIADAMMGDSKKIRTLVLTKASLLRQISQEFTKFVPHRTNSIYGDGIKDLSGDIVIMSYTSYLKFSNKLQNQFNILLLDEAHKGMGPRTRLAIETHRKNAITIGFTASAFYSTDKNLKEFLGKEIYKMSIREAIEIGLLCALQMIKLNISVQFSDKRTTETVQQYEYRISDETITSGSNKALAKFYASVFKPMNLRGILFALTVKQANDLAYNLSLFKVNAHVISNETTKGKRRRILKAFNEGEFDVLIGINIPKEGFDDPGVAVSMFCYPARSFVDIIQGNGRVLRIDPLNPNKLAYIVMPNFIGKKGQVFYHEFLDGYSFIQPKEKRKRGKYKLINEEKVNSETNSIIKSISLDYEDFLKISYNTLHGKAPKGWMTPARLTELKTVQGEQRKITKLAEEYRNGNSEWFKDFLVAGQMREHYHPELVAILKKLCARKEQAPEGWMTANKISKLPEVEGGDVKIKSLAENFRKDNPNWFVNYMSGSLFTEHYHPELVAILKKLCARKEQAPEGWMTAAKLGNSVSINGSTDGIKSLAENFRKDNPNWFAYYKVSVQLTEHYHPELVAILKKLCARKEQAPEGWMTANKLKNLSKFKYAHAGLKGIKSFAEKYRNSHPEWFRTYWTNALYTEHYHPELIILLRQHFISEKKKKKQKNAILGKKTKKRKSKIALNGWMTSSKLSKISNVQGGHLKITKLAEEYRNGNSEWFKDFLVAGQMREHYHPELVAILKKLCARKEQAPEGWMTANKLLESLVDFRVGLDAINSISENYRKENPQWFKKFMSGVRYVEHYHPELIIKIKEVVEKYSLRYGWESSLSISSSNETLSRKIIEVFVENFRKGNPEWFKFLKTKNEYSTEYYHPDLVKKILDYKRPKRVKGWMSANEIRRSGKVRVVHETLTKFSEKFRDQHPEWFMEFRNKNSRISEYYHPDLVKICFEEFSLKSRILPPNNWFSPHQLSRRKDLIGKPNSLIKFAEKFRDQHPEWFKEYWLQSLFVEHYHPDLVVEIEKEFNKSIRINPPNGWFTNRQLEKSFSTKKIKSWVNQFRDEKPEWFNKFITLKGNKFVEHYHPDLVSLISEEFKNK